MTEIEAMTDTPPFAELCERLKGERQYLTRGMEICGEVWPANLADQGELYT